MLNLDEERTELLETNENILIMGGPGSGKTTIALLKAQKECVNLKAFQKVLFLSFARATVMRIVDKSKEFLNENAINNIKISTYHAFQWEILQANWRFLSDYPLEVFLPYEAEIKFKNIPESERLNAFNQEFYNSGKLHFDLFAKKLIELLSVSEPILQIVCDTYPVIIFDEFQDTNQDEWELIKLLGKYSRLIALADPEQRIYDFRGASPTRVTDFINTFSKKVYNFGTDNNRSSGTDIVKYGNDILTGKNKYKRYKNVRIIQYQEGYDKISKHMLLKRKVLEEIKSLQATKKDWSIAILTPSNKLMLEVSEYLYSKQNSFDVSMPAILHEVSIDTIGVFISAICIATLLELGSQGICSEKVVIELLKQHIIVKKEKISQNDEKLCIALNGYLKTGKIQGKNRKALIGECISVSEQVNSAVYSGNIFRDWRFVCRLFETCQSDYLKEIYKDTQYLDILQKETAFYNAIGNLWKFHKNYKDAKKIMEETLSNRYFLMDNKLVTGVNVMTIHKAKGKEFDVVIVYEGTHFGKIVYNDDEIDRAKLNLRVAVTRARMNTFIFTPKFDSCPLL